MEVKTIVIKRIPRATFSGIGAYDKSAESFGCEISGKDGRYKTGITIEEEDYFEKELNLPKGTLKSYSAWWGDNISFNFQKTKNNTMIIDSPKSQLEYKVLLATSKVAKSELERHKTPGAIFYIVDEEAKAQAESEVADLRFEATELLMKLNVEERRSALRLFGKKGVDSMSETVVKNELLKQIDKDSKGFTDILSDKRLKVRMLAEEFVDYGIIGKYGPYYKNGDDTIGSSTEELIDYLEDLKNQTILLAMKTRLTKVKKTKVA